MARLVRENLGPDVQLKTARNSPLQNIKDFCEQRWGPDTFDWQSARWRGQDQPLLLYCHVCGSEDPFERTPRALRKGRGCPGCQANKMTQQEWLYVYRVLHQGPEVIVKIGIASSAAERAHKGMQALCDALRVPSDSAELVVSAKVGQGATGHEQRLLSAYGVPVDILGADSLPVRWSGWTETRLLRDEEHLEDLIKHIRALGGDNYGTQMETKL